MKTTAWVQWRRAGAFFHDFICIPVAWMGAYWLRFNMGEIPTHTLSHAFAMLPWVMLFQTIAFWIFGLYRGVWRFASIPDLIRIVKALSLGSFMAMIAIFFIERLEFLPRSVIPLYGILLLFFLGGSRFVYRWFKDRTFFSALGERALIVGAGAAGESLVRELLRDDARRISPIAFVDDRPQKQGRELHGVRVVGTCDAISEIVKRYAIDRILIAVPSATTLEMRRITALCESTGKSVRTLPGTKEIVSGAVSVKNLRDVSLEDLLGRDPISLDKETISAHLKDKIVLVSGGGGSIGSELCRQILRFSPKKLLIVDHSEYNLFCIEQELHDRFSEYSAELSFHLLDICDRHAINKLLEEKKPEIVFHAAAYKHVPLLEPQARAASKNNIMGTYYLAKSCLLQGVDKFVLVSTDKAVNPTNVMGATKRIAELVCQYFNDTNQNTKFVTVRFGNVLGSRGSVVETFQRQLERGGPLTVTDPEVMRYFMTIPEASQLILQAMVLGEGGEVFVLDMGEPVKIRYMAEQMIRLSGKKIEEVQIEYIGLRPGEKLFEELFHSREKLVETSHVKILKARHRELNHSVFSEQIQGLQKEIDLCNEANIQRLIQRMVPELTSVKPLDLTLA